MIEPRAWTVPFLITDFSRDFSAYQTKTYTVPLTTLADVLAALRQPSEAMIEAGDKKYEGTLIVEEAFLAMLDQFEKEQSE